MAQLVVIEGMVTVNGQVEYRKRMKVRPDDIVEFEGQQVKLV